MDTKDAAETTVPSVAPAKPAPTPKPAGELLATFACKHLRAQAFAHDILSEIQHGGLPGHQCADHLYHLKALYAKSKKSYSLFINFNKAFDSVPHGTLWTVLERANFSTSPISLIKQLYSFP